jgi:hypothetical protein
MRFKSLGLAVVGVLLFVAVVTTMQLEAQKSPRITGTYTNMYYNRGGGDVLGDEIKIVFTGTEFQGALQIAEGVPGPLMVVQIHANGSTIDFVLPDSSPYAGQFSGTIENGILKGEFRFKSGGADKVELRKGKSYWD